MAQPSSWLPFGTRGARGSGGATSSGGGSAVPAPREAPPEFVYGRLSVDDSSDEEGAAAAHVSGAWPALGPAGWQQGPSRGTCAHPASALSMHPPSLLRKKRVCHEHAVICHPTRKPAAPTHRRCDTPTAPHPQGKCAWGLPHPHQQRLGRHAHQPVGIHVGAAAWCASVRQP